ncbi:MAG: hypothetical protein FJ272_02105, partial [Planctomycetes bacterium]|nr:hypothetical protein [Planctomycetota bacterium]
MRTLVASIVALMILCGSPAQAAEYFLDSKNGSDENAGARPDAPFKSLARLSQFSLAPGDVVRLRRGCTFRGQLRFKGNGVEGQPVKVSAYGEGPKPEILGSMWLTDWRPHEGRVHKCAIPPESFVGQKVVYGVFEYDEGRVPVRLQRDKAIPTEPGHFYFDPEALTAYVITSDGAAPANHRLEVSVIDQLVDFADRSWIEVEGLAFLFGNCRHLVLSRCHDVAL